MNNLTDINAYLFEIMDEVTNPDLTTEEFERTMKKASTVVNISKTVIDNGRLMLDATKHADEYHRRPVKKLPSLLTNEED